MDKKPCNCKTEKSVKKTIENISGVKDSKNIGKPLSDIIVGCLKIILPIILFILSIILIVPFILFLLFSKRSRKGIVIKFPLQKQ